MSWWKAIGESAKRSFGGSGNLMEKIVGAKDPKEKKKDGNLERDRKKAYDLKGADKPFGVEVAKQYAKEFHRATNIFDAFINGVNRLVRPLLALSVACVFIMYNAIPFILYYKGDIQEVAFLDMIQEMFALEATLIGAVFTFYFGVRGLEKGFSAFQQVKFSKYLEEKEVEMTKLDTEKTKVEVETQKIVSKSIVTVLDEEIDLICTRKLKSVRTFSNVFSAPCVEAEKKHQIKARALLAIVAQESGWDGEATPVYFQGIAEEKETSHNYFNIKATNNWIQSGRPWGSTDGWEDVNGDGDYDPNEKIEGLKFRVYPGFKESLADYLRLIKERYPKAWAKREDEEAFFESLQHEGDVHGNPYATDGEYARSLTRIAYKNWDYVD